MEKNLLCTLSKECESREGCPHSVPHKYLSFTHQGKCGVGICQVTGHYSDCIEHIEDWDN